MFGDERHFCRVSGKSRVIEGVWQADGVRREATVIAALFAEAFEYRASRGRLAGPRQSVSTPIGPLLCALLFTRHQTDVDQ